MKISRNQGIAFLSLFIVSFFLSLPSSAIAHNEAGVIPNGHLQEVYVQRIKIVDDDIKVDVWFRSRDKQDIIGYASLFPGNGHATIYIRSMAATGLMAAYTSGSLVNVTIWDGRITHLEFWKDKTHD